MCPWASPFGEPPERRSTAREILSEPSANALVEALRLPRDSRGAFHGSSHAGAIGAPQGAQETPASRITAPKQLIGATRAVCRPGSTHPDFHGHLMGHQPSAARSGAPCEPRGPFAFPISGPSSGARSSCHGSVTLLWSVAGSGNSRNRRVPGTRPRTGSAGETERVILSSEH